MKEPKEHSASPFHRYQIFVCVNKRPDDHPRGSCAARGSEEILRQLKDALKAHGLPTGLAQAREASAKMVRAQHCGCHELCEVGPVVMLYPEGAAYRLSNADAVQRFIEKRILGHEDVPDLRITPSLVEVALV